MTPRELSNFIADLFSEAPEVSFIYLSDIGDYISVWVFTSNKRYDDALMDELLDCEIFIMKEFPQEKFDIRYVPLVMIDTPDDVVGSPAVEIYRR